MGAHYGLLTIARRHLTVATLPDGTRTLDQNEARDRWRAELHAGSPPESTEEESSSRQALVEIAVAQLRAMSLPRISCVVTPSRIAYAEALVRLGLLEQADLQIATSEGGIADDTWELLRAVSSAVGMPIDPVELLRDEPARLAAFSQGCRVRPVPAGDEVIFLDGSESIVEPRSSRAAIVARCAELEPEEVARQIVAHALREDPPAARSGDAAIRRVPRERLRCWTVELLAAIETGAPFEWDPLKHTDAQMPLKAIIDVLDALARSGWTVRHVSEDRGIDNNANVSFVTEARYLLSRS